MGALPADGDSLRFHAGASNLLTTANGVTMRTIRSIRRWVSFVSDMESHSSTVEDTSGQVTVRYTAETIITRGISESEPGGQAPISAEDALATSEATWIS